MFLCIGVAQHGHLDNLLARASCKHHQRQAPPEIAVSRGEGELLTAPKPRAVSLLSVYLAVKPVGEPDAGDRHVRFDERGWETGRGP